MNDTINALISPGGSALQPIIYQYFIYYTIEIFTGIFDGNYIYGYACVAFLQLLLMSAAIAWVITWMAKKGIRRGIVYFFMVFYAIFPAFGDYSITLVKDVPFGLCTMLFTVLLYEIISTNGDNLKHPLTMTAFSGLMIILCCVRSNGRIMVFLTAIILLLFEKKSRIHIISVFIPVIIVTVALTVIKNRTGTSEVSFRESIGVPIAQIGETLNVRGEISHEEREVLEQILPLSIWKDNYRFSFADNVKFNSEFNNKWLNENKGLFIKTWDSILQNNFSIYLKAYMFNSYGFWNISPYNRYATDYTQSYFTRINNNTRDDSYWGTFISAIGLKNQNIFPESVSKSFNTFFNRYFRDSLAFGPGMMIAAAFACLSLLLCAKKWKVIISFLPCVLVWLTMMIASPCSLIYRYSLYLLLSLPCYLIITIRELAHQAD